MRDVIIIICYFLIGLGIVSLNTLIALALVRINKGREIE
jgi:hypothetical protein